MPGSIKVRTGRKGAGGFSLVDVVFALAILSVAILGLISLMLVIKTRNEGQSASRHATRACQEVMELILAAMRSKSPTWISDFHNKPFLPRKVVILDKNVPESEAAQKDLEDKTLAKYSCGRTWIKDISDPAYPNTRYEISVWVDTTGLTVPPIKTRLVTRRSVFSNDD